MRWDLARKVADAVLYEGYLLYPYRLSSAKNQYRWQFGVVAPRAWAEHGGDPWGMQTECLIEPHLSPRVDVGIRFLQVQDDQGIERTVEMEGLSLESLLAGTREESIDVPPVRGAAIVSAEQVERWVKLRVRIENRTDFLEAPTAPRSEAMRRSLAGAHTLLAVAGGAFVSLIDPPPEARAAVASCHNLHTWPVLVGREGSREVMLSAPIILQDYPAVAPESQGDFFDATEIDEMLTLRVMTLTEEEKREARATDPRARRIIERCDSISSESFARLHGAIRSTEDFFNPPGEQPESAAVAVGGRSIAKGARVRLAPQRRADSMDLFLAGRTARVQAVHHDLEDRAYVAVTVEDDPASDLHGRCGRFYYFYPDELELVE